MSETTEKRSWLSHAGRWLAELVLVFVGVYGAFWLNNYQQHQEQLQRRDQILAYLQQRLEDGIASVKAEGDQEEKLVTEFQRALDDGKMPPIRPFSFSTDYNPADIATLLQAGGIELLDIKTLTVLRQLESDIRDDLGGIAHFEKLSDELIWPNLDQGFLFLRSGDTQTPKEVRKISGRAEAGGEVFPRRTNKADRVAPANPSRTTTKSLNEDHLPNLDLCLRLQAGRRR